MLYLGTNNLIIRRDRIKELYLVQSIEKVYKIFQYGREIFNNFDYDIVSDKFNQLTERN